MQGKVQTVNRRFVMCEQMKVTAFGLTSSQEFLKAAACVLATVQCKVD
jgi:hypothetical protein